MAPQKLFSYKGRFTQSVKKSALPLITPTECVGVALMILLCFGVLGCTPSRQTPNVSVVNPPSQVAIFPTDVPVTPTILPAKTDIASETPNVEAAYERLSPSKIRIPDINLTVEASGRLTQTVLSIYIDLAVPVDFLTVFPANTDPSIIIEERLSTMSLPLELEFSGGGGGSGENNGIFTAGGNQTYRVKTPLTPGQKIQITIMITFSEYVPMNLPVPLTIDLIVEPASTTP